MNPKLVFRLTLITTPKPGNGKIQGVYVPIYVKRSETRLCDFGTCLGTNFVTKAPQIMDNFLGYFKKHYFLSKKNYGSFLGKLGLENWATFHSNIWSH